MDTPQQRQARHLHHFFNKVFAAGDIVEIRALGEGVSLPTVFSDMRMAARFAIGMSEGGWNVYYTINPLKRDSPTAKSHAPLNYPRLRGLFSTCETDIARINLLPIDIDPVRPSGTASTDVQLADAKQVADCVVAYLTEQGWPEPILVASGNGYYLLYRTETLDDSIWWKQCLGALGSRFNTPTVKIDPSVYNKARILRAPATRNRKGDDTPERPHRLAKVVLYPDQPSAVPEKLVRTLAMSHERVYHSTGARRSQKKLLIDEDDVRDMILSYPEVLTLVGEEVKGTKTLFGLAECPFFGRAHNRQRVGLSKSAIIFDPTINQLGYKCFSSRCAENTFGKLRKLLKKRTGRPTPQIYADEINVDELLDEMGAEWAEGSEPVDPEDGEQAGEILALYQAHKQPDPALHVPTRKFLLRQIKAFRSHPGGPSMLTRLLREHRIVAGLHPDGVGPTPFPDRTLTVRELKLMMGIVRPGEGWGPACA